ncbi:MAG: hypothetical protein HZT43_12425 [Exiguobacterium profundum]|nr:MAG: hypothetical protein HZT43_12425 [Exiguobacterium profundum]
MQRAWRRGRALEPEGVNYRATLDAGAEVALSPLGSVSGGIVHFDAVSPDGVAIILSIYVDGRFAMTVQQDMDGPMPRPPSAAASQGPERWTF